MWAVTDRASWAGLRSSHRRNENENENENGRLIWNLNMKHLPPPRETTTPESDVTQVVQQTKKIECTEEEKMYWSVRTCRGRGGWGWRGDSLEGKHKMWGDGSATGRRRAGQYGPNEYNHTFKRDSSPKKTKHKSISSYLRSRSIELQVIYRWTVPLTFIIYFTVLTEG